MARKHKPEEIIGKLREAEIVLAQGGTVADGHLEEPSIFGLTAERGV